MLDLDQNDLQYSSSVRTSISAIFFNRLSFVRNTEQFSLMDNPICKASIPFRNLYFARS